jgi:hypothetical protein
MMMQDFNRSLFVPVPWSEAVLKYTLLVCKHFLPCLGEKAAAVSHRK